MSLMLAPGLDPTTWLDWLLHGAISVHVGSLRGALSVREVLGNLFGLASAVLGMRRLVWAWPVGVVGNVLLFTVFVTGELSDHAAGEPLWGQAGRQIMFAAVSVYGWWRWRRNERLAGAGAGAAAGAAAGSGADAVVPRWASGGQRVQLLALAVVGYGAAYGLLLRIGSYSPPTEAWILAGSMLATYGMARGWVEFWLVWVAVDTVGVTTLIRAGYYPTAAMYLVYGAFCVVGLAAWTHATRTPTDRAGSAEPTLEGAAR